MARFITLHEIGKDEAYVNIEQITFVHSVKYKTENGVNIFRTQVVVAHGFVEVEETKDEVMSMINKRLRGGLSGV